MPKLNQFSDVKRVQRIIEIIRLISTPHSKLTIYDLATEFSIDKRTINRDLAMLIELGFRFREDSGKVGKKKILKFEKDIPLSIPIGFREDELLALYLTRGIYSFLKGSHFEVAVKSALQKVESLFDDEMLERLKYAVQVKSGPVRNYKRNSESIKVLTKSIINRNIVKISYSSMKSGKFDSFQIHPYSLVFYSNAMYVAAFSEKHSEVRIFAIERIGTITSVSKLFEMVDNIESVLDFENSFGIYSGKVENVKLSVSQKHVKRIKDKILHSSQKFSFARNGNMEIKMVVAGKEDLFRWILSQGDGVKIVEPKAWALEMKKKLKGILKIYDN